MARRKPSPEEHERILQALNALTDAKWTELVLCARFRGSAFKWLGINEEPEDLVQSILLKAILSARNCAVEVDVMAFLKNAIKSLCNQRIKAAYRNAEKRGEFRYYHARCSASPDTGREIAREIVEAVRVLLGEDAEALDVLDSMLDGMPPRDACREFGMAEKQYNTARKRIKRRAHHAATIAAAGFGRTSFLAERLKARPLAHRYPEPHLRCVSAA